jgi:hypothetical protein
MQLRKEWWKLVDGWKFKGHQHDPMKARSDYFHLNLFVKLRFFIAEQLWILSSCLHSLQGHNLGGSISTRRIL